MAGITDRPLEMEDKNQKKKARGKSAAYLLLSNLSSLLLFHVLNGPEICLTQLRGRKISLKPHADISVLHRVQHAKAVPKYITPGVFHL